jgi:hypothetical protein
MDVVPRDLAIVKVAPEGLMFPEEGKLVFEDKELAKRLQEEGIEFLMGDKLTSRWFLKKLSKEAQSKDFDIKQSLKANYIYPVKLDDQDFDPALLDEARERLRDSSRSLSVRYPQTFELFVKVVASMATKFDYDAYQKKLFLDKVRDLWRIISNWKENGLPIYKHLVFLSKLNETMDQVLASPGVEPTAAEAFTWPLHWFQIYTVEGSIYALERLVEKWRELGDPDNAHVFFSIGFYIVPGMDTGFAPKTKRTVKKAIKKVVKATDNTLGHNPKFDTLIEILKKKASGEKIVFDGAEYTIKEVSAPKAGLKLKDSSFRMVLVNEETGAEKQVDCRWDIACNARREIIGVNVCRLLGQSTYAADIYKTFEIDDKEYGRKIEYAWYMVEGLPSSGVEIGKAIDGEDEEIKRRFRGLGALFALEHVLGAYDVRMNDIKMDSGNSFFRTTWKYMLVWSPSLKRAPGDSEISFLKVLLDKENGESLINEVMHGFAQTLERTRREKDHILAVIKAWAKEDEFEGIKSCFEKDLALDHDPKLNTLIEIVRKKTSGERIVFDGAEYSIKEVDFSKTGPDLSLSEFRMVLINEKNGTEKHIVCRWDRAGIPRKNLLDIDVCRMFGLSTHTIDIYETHVMDGIEYAWYMTEESPSSDESVERVIGGTREDKLNEFLEMVRNIDDPEERTKFLKLTRKLLHHFYLISTAVAIAKLLCENDFKFEDSSLKRIKVVRRLDDYAEGSNYRSDKDVSPEVYSAYFSDPLLLKIRSLLAEEKYEELKELISEEKIPSEVIVKAFLLNNQNSIISQTSDLIRDYSGRRGILRWLSPLSAAFDYAFCVKEDLEQVLGLLDISVSDGEFEEIMHEQGFRFFKHKGRFRPWNLFIRRKTRTLIIPLVFDNILSVYRGSAEYDHVEGNYLTHAITTAIVHYANKGGEVRGEGDEYPHGANAFHEFDLGFMMVEGRNHRKRDPDVTLAFNYKGVPLPEYARKRTFALKGATVAGHISQLMEWQLKERRAKQNIHKIFKWIIEGKLSKDELARAIDILSFLPDFEGNTNQTKVIAEC